MKLAIWSEGPDDAHVGKVLVDAIVGSESVEVSDPVLRNRQGWPFLRNNLSVVARHVYYRTDADALVVLVDADESPIRLEDAAQPDMHRPTVLQGEYARALANPRPRPCGKHSLRLAVGLCVPTMEAWCLYGVDPHATEASWRTFGSGSVARRALKRALYGDRFDVAETRQRVLDARLPVLSANLDGLERAFPQGFGRFRNDVRGWIAPS